MVPQLSRLQTVPYHFTDLMPANIIGTPKEEIVNLTLQMVVQLLNILKVMKMAIYIIRMKTV